MMPVMFRLPESKNEGKKNIRPIQEIIQSVINEEVTVTQVVETYYKQIEKFNENIKAIDLQPKEEVFKRARVLGENLKQLGSQKQEIYPLIGTVFSVDGKFQIENHPIIEDCTVAGSIFIGKINQDGDIGGCEKALSYAFTTFSINLTSKRSAMIYVACGNHVIKHTIKETLSIDEILKIAEGDSKLRETSTMKGCSR